MAESSERKQRNPRIRAGALGAIVALAIGTIFVRSLTSDPIPADPPVEPRPTPAASGTLAYVLDDGDVYVADPDGSNAVRIANGLSDGGLCLHRRALVLGRGIDVVARREVPRLSPRGLFQRATRNHGQNWGDVVISDAAGNVFATFPADGWDIGWSPDSSRVRCGTPCSRRSASTGSTAPGMLRSRCRPDGNHPAITTQRGCATGRWRSTTWRSRPTAARRGGSTRFEWRSGGGLSRHDWPPRGLARRIASRVRRWPLADD